MDRGGRIARLQRSYSQSPSLLLASLGGREGGRERGREGGREGGRKRQTG